GSPEQAFATASRVLRETQAQAVKLEGGEHLVETVAFLTTRGIPVMGHIGLTPQSINTLGGFKTQGKSKEVADALLASARAIDDAGCFAVVIEGVLEAVATQLHDALSVPSIGIGASVDCDGQILVTDDLIGMFDEFKPKFVKRYAQVLPDIRSAIDTYAQEVRARDFPTSEYTFQGKQ
ncbi:MAG: 3-methyl-2-oxobutanoate hydroxymethyltransferase, partial [Pseudomonadota bacterium]